MNRALISAALLLAACGSFAAHGPTSTTTLRASSTGPPSVSPVATSPVSGTPTPNVSSAPTASPSPAASAPSCSLPVEKVSGGPPDQPVEVGFVRLPAGHYSPDSTPMVTPQPNPLPSWTTSSVTFDVHLRRWLPVPPAWEAPDGSYYVYSAPDGSVHAVQTAGGSDGVMVPKGSSPSGHGWLPVGFGAAGLYLAAAVDTNAPAPAPDYGLWLFNRSDGTVRAILNSDVWASVGPDAAWGVVPQTASSLLRLPLSGGTPSNWYAAPSGSFIRFYGLDRTGHPLVSILGSQAGPVRIALVTSPGTLQDLGPLDATGPEPTSVLDGLAGTWFATADGSVYLRSPAGAIDRVAAVGTKVDLAGDCS